MDGYVIYVKSGQSRPLAATKRNKIDDGAGHRLFTGQYIMAVEFYGYFEREVFHFYGGRLHRNALHDRNIARAFRTRLTMDNAINFTSRSTPLVMDLQYVANGAREAA